ncbi:hypothetical protein WCLP8_5010003 [uncultured Gammaproteobacteria bacterium]
MILGLTTGFEVQVMEALDLQGAEQGLGHGVVPAIAFAAHGPNMPEIRLQLLVKRFAEMIQQKSVLALVFTI